MTFEEYEKDIKNVSLDSQYGLLSRDTIDKLLEYGIGCKYCNQIHCRNRIKQSGSICYMFHLDKEDFKLDNDGLHSLFSDNSSSLAIILKNIEL